MLAGAELADRAETLAHGLEAVNSLARDLDQALAVLQETGLTSGALQHEVTETAVITDMDSATAHRPSRCNSSWEGSHTNQNDWLDAKASAPGPRCSRVRGGAPQG
jgi:hypothetical protein